MNTNQKVCIDASPLFNTNHGIGSSTATLIQHLMKEDTEIDFSLFGRKLIGPALKMLSQYQVPHHHMRLPRSAEKLIQKIGLMERLCKADLYHATDFYLPLKESSNYICTIHDLIYEHLSNNLIDHKRISLWVKTMIKESNRISTKSEYYKKDIIK